MVCGFKSGATVIVVNACNRVGESATVARVTKDMLPLPDGYVPVKFADDGARLLVHQRYIQKEPT